MRSPEEPCSFPGDPGAKQEIGDGMGGHGVAETFMSADEALVDEAAEDASDPLVGVCEPEDEGGAEERPPGKVPERDVPEVRFDEPTVDERPVENLFERRDDQG